MRNLVMSYHPDGLDPADFLKIARRIKELASDIAVYIVTDRPQPPTKLQLLAQRRTLVFSPHRLKYFKPLRGAVYCGRRLAKDQQIETFGSARNPRAEVDLSQT